MLKIRLKAKSCSRKVKIEKGIDEKIVYPLFFLCAETRFVTPNPRLTGPWTNVLNFGSVNFTNSAEEKFSINGKIFQRLIKYKRRINMYTNYYQPNPTQVQTYQNQLRQQQLTLKGRPVSSIEEAKASSIDFDGSVFYFPDLANKRIYTKQINLDGTSSLLMYELKEVPIEPPAASYVTRDEFEKTINQLKALLVAPTTQEEKPQQEFNF